VWAHILWILVPLYFYGRLLNSDAYAIAVSIAKNSPEMRKALGEGIHTQWLPVGSALPRYSSDFAEWSVNVSGSSGHGRLYGVANRIGSYWEFSRLTFVSAKDGASVDLTPVPILLHLPPVSGKKVYLIPLSLAPEASLDWAPAYYKAKLGVEVEILPPIELSTSELDQARHQYEAEKCIDLIIRSHRELSTDPSAILVGVTSQDMFIEAFDWKYAENFRTEGRLGVVSSARMQPTEYPGKWNKELFNSRLKKMLTKNIAVLYFNLPLSRDTTSLLSAGVLSGNEIDYMSGQIVGGKNHWDPLYNPGEPEVSMTVAPGKPIVWTISSAGESVPNTRLEFFSVDLAIGLFIQRKIDFYIDDQYPLTFARVYRNADDRSRPFGIGAYDSLDVFLVGQMESFVDLIQEDGGRVHFVYVAPKPGELTQTYLPSEYSGRYARAIYESGDWRVEAKNGWTYFFPYHRKAREPYVSALTGFVDPGGHKYEMVRDDTGDLLSITTPSGKWLHFEHDREHRIRHIQDSMGRLVNYEYNSRGQLRRVSDSEGESESYTYNDRNEMISVVDAAGVPILTNKYDMSTNSIASQALTDGRSFEYGYTYASRMVITKNYFKDPNGLMTYFDYLQSGYFQSIPVPPSHRA
jgi:YD repeat-containing protein